MIPPSGLRSIPPRLVNTLMKFNFKYNIERAFRQRRGVRLLTALNIPSTYRIFGMIGPEQYWKGSQSSFLEASLPEERGKVSCFQGTTFLERKMAHREIFQPLASI